MALNVFVMCVLVLLHIYLNNGGLKLSKLPDIIHGNQMDILARQKTEIKLRINNNNCWLRGESGHENAWYCWMIWKNK